MMAEQNQQYNRMNLEIEGGAIQNAEMGMYRSIFNQLEQIRRSGTNVFALGYDKYLLTTHKNSLEMFHDLLSPYEDETFLTQYNKIANTLSRFTELVDEIDDRPALYQKLRFYFRELLSLMRRNGLGLTEQIEDIIDVETEMNVAKDLEAKNEFNNNKPDTAEDISQE